MWEHKWAEFHIKNMEALLAFSDVLFLLPDHKVNNVLYSICTVLAMCNLKGLTMSSFYIRETSGSTGGSLKRLLRGCFGGGQCQEGQ